MTANKNKIYSNIFDSLFFADRPEIVNEPDFLPKEKVSSTYPKKQIFKFSFSATEKLFYIYPKIINLSNERIFHTRLKEPIFYPKKMIF